MSEQMTEFQRNLVRMWDSLRERDKGTNNCCSVRCDDCPLDEKCCFPNRGGVLFNAEKVIEIVTQWAKEHPFVTYEQKYEEVFGVKPLDFDGDYICPLSLRLKSCNHKGGNGGSCAKCVKDFWQSEYKEPKKEGE